MEPNNTPIDNEQIQRIGGVLNDCNRPLKERFRALFTLKNIGGDVAIDCICKCFADESALLKHECAYCLGQMQDPQAIPQLIGVLKDTNQDTMVRHEAGEALGAIGSADAISVLEQYCSDPSVEVAETCQLAVERLRWLQQKETESSANPYASVDPAPPARENDLNKLQEKLLDEKLSLFERYRAMFSLRNLKGSEAALVLAEGLKCSSALFRHEVAYVLGQMQEESSVPQLTENLMDSRESAMVRHECAEALGAIGTQQCMDTLQVYAKDNERVVKESCEVALDMCDYAQSAEFQYANTLTNIENNS